MGYELDKLMQQFGVNTPTLSYSGVPLPVKPTDLSATASATDRANYDALLAKYNADTPLYTSDQTKYKTYSDDYKNRLATTSLYDAPQFQKSVKSSPGTGMFTDNYSQMFQDVLGRLPDSSELAYWKNKFGDMISPSEYSDFMQSSRDGTVRPGKPNPSYLTPLKQPIYNAATESPILKTEPAITPYFPTLTDEDFRNGTVGGSGGGYDSGSANSAFDKLTNEEKAAYYSANPKMSSLTQALQNAFGFTSLGMLQKGLVPDFVREQQAIAQGTEAYSGYRNFGKESTIPSGGMVSPGLFNPYAGDSAKDAGRAAALGPTLSPIASPITINEDGSKTYTLGKAAPLADGTLPTITMPSAAQVAAQAQAAAANQAAVNQVAFDREQAAQVQAQAEQQAAQAQAAAQATAMANAAASLAAAEAANQAAAAAAYSGPSTSSGPEGTTSSSSDSDCVDPSTLILLANGTQIPAGKLKVGDFLHTLHEDTFVYGDFEVVYVKTVQQPKNIVTFTDGHNLTASDSHKFLMSNRTWKRVDALEAGDTVETAKGVNPNGFKTVAKIEAIGLGDVVKLSVDQAHTYISEGLVSHNKAMHGGGYIGSYAQGGLGSLGGYSDGGRLLRGPGDGVSDSIPATIGDRQPARLANNEFVIPARIVSEIGNGSTDAGAKRLYQMMDRIQNARKKSMGKGKIAVDSKAYLHLPA